MYLTLPLPGNQANRPIQPEHALCGYAGMSTRQILEEWTGISRDTAARIHGLAVFADAWLED